MSIERTPPILLVVQLQYLKIYPHVFSDPKTKTRHLKLPEVSPTEIIFCSSFSSSQEKMSLKAGRSGSGSKRPCRLNKITAISLDLCRLLVELAFWTGGGSTTICGNRLTGFLEKKIRDFFPRVLYQQFLELLGIFFVYPP